MSSVGSPAIKRAPKQSTTKPAGYFLARFSLLVVLCLLILAAWRGQLVIVVLLGIALAAAGLSQLWSRFSLKRVTCERSLSESRVFPGEHIELYLRLQNRKLLPLAWVQVEDEVPIKFVPEVPLTPSDRLGFGLISHAASLLWYSAANWQTRLYCHKRGYYPIGPLVITSGDIFGFYPRSITDPSVDHVIVYPKIFPISQLGIPSQFPLGETRNNKPIFMDPIRTIGVRDYTPHDSIRHIHWKASARHQTLQVKVFEPTTIQKVALFLAVDSFAHGTGIQAEEDFEFGISVVASVASFVSGQRNPVGLYVNTLQADSGQPVAIPPGSGARQLVNILEGLAKTTSEASHPFEKFLQSQRQTTSWGTTMVIVVSKASEALIGVLSDLADTGHRPVVLQVGEQTRPAPGNRVNWINIKQSAGTMDFKEAITLG